MAAAVLWYLPRPLETVIIVVILIINIPWVIQIPHDFQVRYR